MWWVQNENDSWFGHLALCIVLRHCVAVFRRDESGFETFWEGLLIFLYKIQGRKRKRGWWLPTKGTFTSLFLPISRSVKPWAKSMESPFSYMSFFHGRKGSSLPPFTSDVPSTQGHCLKYRGERRNGAQWHSYGIWCVTPVGLQSNRFCWSSAVGFEQNVQVVLHICA